MHLLIIATIIALILREESIGEELVETSLRELGRGGVAAISLGLMAAVWMIGHLLISRQVRRLDRGLEHRRDQGSGHKRPRRQLSPIAWADRVAFWMRLGGLAVHFFNVLALGWLDLIRGITGDLVLVDEVLAVLPVFSLLVLSWWSLYPIERRVREAVLLRDLDEGRPVRSIPAPWVFVLSTARQQAAMVVVPIMIIYSWNELVQRAAGRDLLPQWLPELALQFAGAALALTFMPLVLRRVWDTIHLEPGPLREDLISMCREHRIRIRDVLLWRTHGTMINGAVLGLVGPARYILLTDALLELLPGQQVRAVMAHELGHIRQRHMWWLAAAALTSIILASTAADLVLRLVSFRWSPGWFFSDTAQVIIMVVGIASGLFIFGLVSRRFEWQADAFAVQHLSGWRGRQTRSAKVQEPGSSSELLINADAVSAMAGALGSVAALNHIPVHRFTWRHGSIATRQKKLLRLVGAPARGLKVDRDAAVMKALIAGGMLLVGLLLVLNVLLDPT